MQDVIDNFIYELEKRCMLKNEYGEPVPMDTFRRKISKPQLFNDLPQAQYALWYQDLKNYGYFPEKFMNLDQFILSHKTAINDIKKNQVKEKMKQFFNPEIYS